MGILTRWHRLRDAVAAGETYLATTPSVLSRPADLPPGAFDPAALAATLSAMDGAPRFVLEDGLPGMVVTREATLSIADMQHCGVLEMPYPACVVEYDAGDTRYSVHIGEAQATSRAMGYRWAATPVGLQVEAGRDIALAFPVVVEIGVVVPETREGEPDAPTEEARFHYRARLASHVGEGPDTVAAAEAVASFCFQRCAIALMSAVLLPNAIGLAREPATARALNKSRAARRKALVPDYTLLRVAAYVTEAGETRRAVPGAAHEVHLRRGHKRRVAVGVGRSGRAWRYIQPQVVGYLPGGYKPTIAELLATRAAKPYLVRT